MEKITADKNSNWTYGLAWSPKLETGYEEIDSQHKQLFILVSDLIESCQKNEAAVTIEEVLYFLLDYTEKHFSDEEKISLRYRYPHHDEHKEMHGVLKKNVAVFIEQYKKNGFSKILFSALTKMIVKWLINHIQGEDFKIANHIKEYQKNYKIYLPMFV